MSLTDITKEPATKQIKVWLANEEWLELDKCAYYARISKAQWIREMLWALMLDVESYRYEIKPIKSNHVYHPHKFNLRVGEMLRHKLEVFTIRFGTTVSELIRIALRKQIEGRITEEEL